jgi:hypothetical protein
MLGLMQDWPLLLHRIIDHANANHGERPVVTRSIEGPIETTTYAAIHGRALRLAKRLERDGIKLGDRVATLAWNSARHLEAWYAIVGIGAIYHTVNPRLFPDQIAWIMNHAEDRIAMIDLTFVSLLEKLADKLPTVERYVVLTDSAHMPTTSLKNAVPYEDWLSEVDGDFAWKTFDENTAAGMCYTSGTTGNPKGVLYSHRSNVLHALIANAGDMLGISAGDVVMPVVPLFHANGWALAFAAPMAGASLIMPGMKLDGASVYELLNDYKVTGADRVARPAAISGNGGGEAAVSAASDYRRLRLPARGDRNIPGCVRSQGYACVGHDRDEPAWNRVQHKAGLCRPERRGAHRRAAEARARAVRRRDEDHRRWRRQAAVGRQDLRPTQGTWSGGGQGLLQGRP